MTEWSRPYSLGLYVAAVAAVLVLIIIARRTAISDRLRSWSLFLPRLGVFALLLMIMLNPVKRTEHRLPPKPATVQFLVDGSRSMALEQPISRAAAAQQVIQEVNARLTQPDRPQVQLFRFGQQLASAADLSQLSPRDDVTELAAALEQLPSRFTREPPRAIVVFSDGIADDAARLKDIAVTYQQMKIPVHVYPVGNKELRGDLAIDDLVVPPKVDAGAKVPIRGTVRGSGFAGTRAVLQVRSKDRPQLAPVATLPLTLSETAQPFEMVVEANPDYGELELVLPPQAGEVTQVNNRVPFHLARANRKLRVIYMEGTGSNEYHWVHDALIEDKDIECLSMVADAQYTARPRLIRVGDSLRGFPATRQELLQYDVVICSDISQGAFTREQLAWTVELVAERGGGFAMVGGHTSFGSGGWDQTSWDKLIPIDMAGGVMGQGWVYHQFAVTVPAEAQQHPIWRILEDPEQNKKAIAAMPPFLGTNFMQRLKPAATVLANSATPIPQAGIMPIFAAQPYGRGRTFAFAPDTTADWGRLFESQWGENSDNRYFRRFWRNVVRWLGENSAAGNKRLQATANQVIYRAGQSVKIDATAFDEKLQPTTDYDLTAKFILPSDPRGGTAAKPDASQTVSLKPTGINKEYRGELPLTALPPVDFLATDASAIQQTQTIAVVATSKGKEIARVNLQVQILPDLHELLQPQAQPKNLHDLATATNGQVLHNSGELFDVLEQMPSKPGDSIVSRQPLWDSPILWLMVLGLLAIEWSLRRLAGYG
jgi:uncharacterized membrane protein